MELNCTAEKSEKETIKPSWRRRALKIILWLVGVPIALAVLLTIYFCIGGIEWGDWTIPDETDLRLEVREVPDEENAYLALQALTNVYHVAEGDDESAEISDETFVMYYGDPSFRGHVGDDLGKWSAIRSDPASPERAARILADNAEFFEGFKKALSLNGYVDVDCTFCVPETFMNSPTIPECGSTTSCFPESCFRRRIWKPLRLCSNGTENTPCQTPCSAGPRAF